MSRAAVFGPSQKEVLDALSGSSDLVMILGEKIASDVPEGAVDSRHCLEARSRETNAVVGEIDYLMVDLLTPATEDIGVCLHELVVPD